MKIIYRANDIIEAQIVKARGTGVGPSHFALQLTGELRVAYPVL